MSYPIKYLLFNQVASSIQSGELPKPHLFRDLEVSPYTPRSFYTPARIVQGPQPYIDGRRWTTHRARTFVPEKNAWEVSPSLDKSDRPSVMGADYGQSTFDTRVLSEERAAGAYLTDGDLASRIMEVRLPTIS